MVLIEQHVLNAIESVVQECDNRVESGGLLLGYRKQGAFHVTEYTTPKKKDVSKKYSFERQDPKHQIFATYHWLKSGFRCDWLGEWHSHPESHPSPSDIDIRSWRDQVEDRKIPMCYVILGMSSHWIGILNQEDKQPVELPELCYLKNSLLAR